MGRLTHTQIIEEIDAVESHLRSLETRLTRLREELAARWMLSADPKKNEHLMATRVYHEEPPF